MMDGCVMKTNGNGGKTDVGVWFVTYNTPEMWANNFGSGHSIDYRVLLPDGSYEVDADQSVSDVLELLGLDDPEENEELINTLMGEWAYEQFTAIPKPGDSFTYHRVLVTVSSMEHNRILKLNVRLIPEDTEGGRDK